MQDSDMDDAQPGEEKRSDLPIQVKTISNSPYSAETRKKALELIAEIGISSTARKLGISTSTLSNWKIANGIEAGPIQSPNIQLPRVPPSHHYDEDTRRQALALVAEIGVCAAEKVLGISRRTLTVWRKAAGIPATGCAVRYSQETKQKAVEMIQRQGSPESERQTGISYRNVSNRSGRTKNIHQFMNIYNEYRLLALHEKLWDEPLSMRSFATWQEQQSPSPPCF